MEDECLLVRNAFRTHRIAWDSISELRLVSTMTVWAFLTDGTKVHIVAMTCYPFGRGYVPLIARLYELRAIAAERRGRSASEA